MSGLEASFSLERPAYFERSLKNHLKGLSKREQVTALELFGELFSELMESPRQMRGQAFSWLEKMIPEKWPGPVLAAAQRGALSIEGWEFWKAYVNLPYAQGAARKGRVMYAIDGERKTIHLLMFYTHAEYQGRPDDSFLADVMRESNIPPRE